MHRVILISMEHSSSYFNKTKICCPNLGYWWLILTFTYYSLSSASEFYYSSSIEYRRASTEMTVTRITHVTSQKSLILISYDPVYTCTISYRSIEYGTCRYRTVLYTSRYCIRYYSSRYCNTPLETKEVKLMALFICLVQNNITYISYKNKINILRYCIR